MPDQVSLSWSRMLNIQGRNRWNRKQGVCPFCASVKDNQMLHSDRDFLHCPDIPLSDFLCTSSRQNVPPFNLRTMFLQAQPNISKRKAVFLQLFSQVTQPNKEDVLRTIASTLPKAFHSLQTSASSILHDIWFVEQIIFSSRKRNLVTSFYCSY